MTDVLNIPNDRLPLAERAAERLGLALTNEPSGWRGFRLVTVEGERAGEWFAEYQRSLPREPRRIANVKPLRQP